VNRFLALLLLGTLLASSAAPALAVDPTPSPSPVTEENLPVPDADLLERIPVTITGGRIGATMSPAALIFTDVDGRGGTVRVGNPSDQLLRIRIQVRDYTIDAEGNVAVDANGEPTVGTPNYQYASASWYNFAPYEEFLLPAGRIATIPFTIDVPTAASPGDHTAALIVLARRADTESPEVAPGEIGIGVYSQYRFLVRLQHRVAGAEALPPTVKVVTDVDGSRRIDLVATIDNNGTTVLDYKPYRESDPVPVFRITAKNSGELIREFKVLRGFYVLPEGNRILSVTWRDEQVVTLTGSDAEIARLKADEKNTESREELGMIRSQLRVAETRKALNAALVEIDESLAGALDEVKTAIGAWYATQRETAELELADVLVATELERLVADAAERAQLSISDLAPLAALAAAEQVATVELQIFADTAALPPTGDYVVELVLPKRGDVEQVIARGEFSFVNADPTKRLSDSSPLLLVVIGLGAGLTVLGGVVLLRRRREQELNAE
jgi:hypothetical protein